jgi:hypothetical protein
MTRLKFAFPEAPVGSFPNATDPDKGHQWTNAFRADALTAIPPRVSFLAFECGVSPVNHAHQ